MPTAVTAGVADQAHSEAAQRQPAAQWLAGFPRNGFVSNALKFLKARILKNYFRNGVVDVIGFIQTFASVSCVLLFAAAIFATKR